MTSVIKLEITEHQPRQGDYQQTEPMREISSPKEELNIVLVGRRRCFRVNRLDTRRDSAQSANLTLLESVSGQQLCQIRHQTLQPPTCPAFLMPLFTGESLGAMSPLRDMIES